MNFSSSIILKLKKKQFLAATNHLKHYFDCMTCAFCTQSSKSSASLESILNTSLEPYINLSYIDGFNKFIRSRRYNYRINRCVANENVAKDIASKILANTNIKKGILFEENAGLGLLTLHLLKSGVPKIYVFEQQELKKFCLLQIIKKYPEVLEEFSDSHQKTGYNCFTKSFTLAQDNNLTPIFVGVHNNFSFFKFLINFLRKMNLWNCEFECFSVVTTNMIHCLREFNSIHLKFLPFLALNVFCDIKILEKYPHSAFLPVPSNDEDMFLLKISRNLKSAKLFDKDEHLEYLIFANTLGTNRNSYIIPILEKWLPDCGPYLISKGMSVTTQLADLTPEETVTLFKLCKNCDGYRDFLISAETFYKENLP